jgi:hypothetical protein
LPTNPLTMSSIDNASLQINPHYFSFLHFSNKAMILIHDCDLPKKRRRRGGSGISYHVI